MTPVFVIEGKVIPCLESSVFFHSRYDEAEVSHNEFLVHVQYFSTSSILVTPHGKNFGGKMVVRIVCCFADEG